MTVTTVDLTNRLYPRRWQQWILPTLCTRDGCNHGYQQLFCIHNGCNNSGSYQLLASMTITTTMNLTSTLYPRQWQQWALPTVCSRDGCNEQWILRTVSIRTCCNSGYLPTIFTRDGFNNGYFIPFFSMTVTTANLTSCLYA